ncbi:two-component sensor histidine kinase [Paraburkholderia steynii]|uniref:histidine kinase n=1 Tax=Paraburkholderia steynii TaxID=1245441 RepID=A0A4R0X5M3_9BURK|nr:two-component sensor histidine kinase [Paraburkholderia steynii]
MKSIRRWLLGWLIAGLAVSALTAGYAIFHTARDEAGELFDYELRTVAESLPANIRSAGTALQSKPDFESLSEDRLFIEVWGQAGGSVYKSLGGLDLPRFPAGLRTIERDEYRWRVYGVQQGERFIQIAQPISVREDLALRLALRTLAPLALFIPTIIVIVLFVVGRGLAPLTDISRALTKRSFDSLEPLRLAAGTPIEIEPLVHALNDLLHRLDVASKTQRTFVADAAHELRSPLAALKLQLQSAERDGSLVGNKETFDRIEGRLNRLIHLVRQLLTLAREEAQTGSRLQSVSLRRLCERVVADISLLAEAKQIDLGLECRPATQSDDIFEADVEPAGIEILLNNLIDNAIRYTPKGGTVDVIPKREGEAISLAVSDSGPGIPDEERERVFDRFYRSAGTKEQGSGLGLAIVLKIAQHHHATLQIQNNSHRAGLHVILSGLGGTKGS